MKKNQLGTFVFMSSLSMMAWSSDKIEEQKITRSEELVTETSVVNFSNPAHFSRFPMMPSGGDVAPAIVNFTANSITNWHIHPQGQYLIVTEGEGRTQEWGKPIQTIKAGDIVWCPPNVKHWHGASQYSPMSHIAITPVTQGKSVIWLEKVSLEDTHRTDVKLNKSSSVQLTDQQFTLISIAASNVKGEPENLKKLLIQGLESGLTINQINEFFAHQAAYIGFPRALKGMLVFKALIEMRRQQGILDEQGVQPKSLPSSTNYYQLGTETLADLNNTDRANSVAPLFDNFSPTMDYALKSYLFGYLFSRDNLSSLDRELIVVTTLVALGDVNPQLRSHLRIIRNLGVDATQMHKVMVNLQQVLEKEQIENADYVLKQLAF